MTLWTQSKQSREFFESNKLFEEASTQSITIRSATSDETSTEPRPGGKTQTPRRSPPRSIFENPPDVNTGTGAFAHGDSPPTEPTANQVEPVVFVNNESFGGIHIDNAIAKDNVEFLDHTIRANLPPYKKAEHISKDYNGINKIDFFPLISNTYEDIVTWKKNLFKLPSGKCGREFIKLMTDWLQKYNSDSTFQCIAMKVVMILPNILLQKPSATSKSRPHQSSRTTYQIMERRKNRRIAEG